MAKTDTKTRILDTAERIAMEHFLPHAALLDRNEPKFVDGKVEMDPAVGAGVLQVAVTAAACDDPSDGFAACHRYQQDWGIPVEVSPGASTGLDLDLRSV